MTTAITSHHCRQPEAWRNTAPTVRPISAAMPWNVAQLASATFSRRGGATLRIRAGATTTASRNPTPSSVRAAISSSVLGAAAPSAEAALRRSRPETRGRRRPAISPPTAVANPPTMLATWMMPSSSPACTSVVPRSAWMSASAAGSFRQRAVGGRVEVDGEQQGGQIGPGFVVDADVNVVGERLQRVRDEFAGAGETRASLAGVVLNRPHDGHRSGEAVHRVAPVPQQEAGQFPLHGPSAGG
ncbi:hypothetical protein ABIB45_001522 [Arthrobacter sp. UYCo732]